MSKLHSSEVASFLVKDIEYLNKKYAYLQNSSSSPTSIENDKDRYIENVSLVD